MLISSQLAFLKALILWALASSEAVQNVLRDGYKQARHGKDRYQPLAVQPWGHDTWKRRYWLIEGRDDTHFRLYRESNPALKTNTWWSVAGTIEEIKAVAESLATEKSRAAKELSKKIFDNVPRFEGSEEVRVAGLILDAGVWDCVLTRNRNGNGVTTAWLEKLLSLARKAEYHCTKVVPVGRESSIRFPMTRMIYRQTPFPPGNLPEDNPVSLLLRNLVDL